MTSNSSVKIFEQENFVMMAVALAIRAGMVPMWFLSFLSLFLKVFNTGELFKNLDALFKWAKPVQEIASKLFHVLGNLYNSAIVIPFAKLLSLMGYAPKPLTLSLIIFVILTAILLVVFSANTYNGLKIMKQRKEAKLEADALSSSGGNGGKIGGVVAGGATGLLVAGPIGFIVGSLLGGLLGASADAPDKEKIEAANSKVASLDLATQAAIRTAAMLLFTMICLWGVFYFLYFSDLKHKEPLSHGNPRATHSLLDAGNYLSGYDYGYSDYETNDSEYINNF